MGLLTKVALVEEKLPAAVRMYEQTDGPDGAFGASVDEFTHDHCHPAAVDFLGVFDTVGALGVPGFMRHAPRFHDVQLSAQILRARHALAVDETRLKFAPTFWEAPAEPSGAPTEDARVKQVWFEGAHSDVGGGYRQTGLSDTSLLWMAREARAAGLVFDVPLLTHYVNSGSDPIRHNPLNRMFKVDNWMLGARTKLSREEQASGFSDGLRLLTNDRALSVRVASSAVTHFQEGGYEPANLKAFAGTTNGFKDIVEPVVALPEAGVDLLALGSTPAESG